MAFLHNAVWLLVLLGVMILIHELGHFWAAKYFGVGVEVFSFGFGPRLFGFRRGETDYRFSALFMFGGGGKKVGEGEGRQTRQRRGRRPSRTLRQAEVAASDHRICRTVHELHPGRRITDRP